MKKVCLVVIDGWGHRKEGRDGDAIDSSECHWMRLLSSNYKSFLISAHGSHVGLLPGLMGNSEVGHLTIGSGRVVEQDVLRIERSINSRDIDKVVSGALEGCRNKVHLVGMVSDGGVHSHIKHLKAILLAMRSYNTKVYIHCISDGRDTAPCVFPRYLKEITEFCSEVGVGEVVSIAGRFYTMDRANNDERVDASFEMMTNGREICSGVEEHINGMYERGLTDEMFQPFLIAEEGRVHLGETILFFNFRADRMRQIVERFIENKNEVITMTEYKKEFNAKVLFERLKIRSTLAEVLSNHGIRHTHIAEQEKQAHVTYFFNGGREESFPRQKVTIIPSPSVRSFDAVPEMASSEVTTAAIDEMKVGIPFVILNLAPPDMVGHTGNFEATKKAVKATDDCIGQLYESCKENGYVLVVTADHGNAEEMEDRDGGCCKTHTTNKVPLIICMENKKQQSKIQSGWGYKDSEYSLKDIPPTVLEIMGIEKPAEMTGNSVLSK